MQASVSINANMQGESQKIQIQKHKVQDCSALQVPDSIIHKVWAPGSMEEGWQLGLEEAEATCAWGRPPKVCWVRLSMIILKR